MSVLNPAALWGLLALVVPVLIHLFNANRGRKRLFAARRFVDPAEAQQMRNVFLTEWFLLLLRCLLIATVVLWLAEPERQPRTEFRGPVAVLISPLAVAGAGSVNLVTASEIARQQGADLRLLAPGFPVVRDRDPEMTVSGGAWSLLAELEHHLPDEQQVVLLVADDPRESGWRRPSLDREVSEIQVTPATQRPAVSRAIAVVADPDRAADARYLEAALTTMAESGTPLRLVEADQQPDLMFVLGRPSIPAGAIRIQDAGDADLQRRRILRYQGERFDVQVTDADHGIALLATEDGSALASIQRLEEATQLTWHSRFHPDQAAVVGSRVFPDLLEQLLQTADPSLAEEQAPQPAPTSASPESLRHLLALLIIVLWLAERWFATRTTRGNRVPQPA